MGVACRAPSLWLGALLIGSAVTLCPPGAQAGSSNAYSACHKAYRQKPIAGNDWRLCFGILMWGLPSGGDTRSDAPEPSAALARTGLRTATYILTNFGATLSKSEPDYGGRMKTPTWGHIEPDRPMRLVLHTFGSDIDTVLAAYRVKDGRGSKIAYELVKGNDDTAVPGVGRGWSLAAVDLKKGESYQVQISGQDGAESDRIALTATSFGPDGGVSAFLLSTSSGPTMQGRDYVCEQRPCPSATFVLHNSARSAARVTPSTVGLSRFLKDPAPVTIAPGGLAVATFTALDFSSVGGISEGGSFTFKATVGGKSIESVEKPGAVFVMDPAGSTPGIEMTAKDRLQVGDLNEPMRFRVSLTNTGSGDARGCAFRTLQSNFRNVLTRFRTLTASGKPSGDWGEATDIAAGKSQDFEVEIASMATRQGDPAFGLADEMQGGCVNRSAGEPDLLGTLEINADGSGLYTVIDTGLSGGASLAVPAKGQASFDVAATNKLDAARMNVRPVYVYPFDASDPDQRYAMSVCRLDKTKKRCDGPKDFSAPWAAKKGAKASFRVFVTAPREKPPADPGRFRIYLKFEGEDASWPNLFGAESVAVRVK